MVRLGVVGCGAVVRAYHMPALAAVPEITVSALCDLNRHRAIRLQKEFELDAVVTETVDALAAVWTPHSWP
jgi:predicted dehydrogenase